MDVLVEMVSFERDTHSWKEKRTALLVFMESPIVPVPVGTKGRSKCPSRFIIGITDVIIVNGDF